MEPIPFELVSDGFGRGRILMDGKDITPWVTGIQVGIEPNKTCMVGVSFMNVELNAELEAWLHAQIPSLNGSGLAAEELKKLDAKSIEAQVLEGLDYDDSIVPKTIAVLIERLSSGPES